MKKRIRLLAFLLSCIMALSLFTGCSSGAITGENTRTEESAKPSTNVVVPPSSDVYTLKMQTSQGTNQIEYTMLEEVCEEIKVVSNGRLIVELYPNGTFASSMEIFNACMNGVFDIASGYGTWMKGIDFGFHVMTTGNMTMDWNSKVVWLNEFGGNEMITDALHKVGLEFITMHTDGTETAHANKEFTSIASMSGKKFRTSDARLLNELGVPAVTYSLEELFTAFSTGAVDIAEYGYLAYNRSLGLTDVSKYSIYPDFWNVSNSLTIAMNSAKYESLPSDLQQILKMAFKAYELEHYTRTQYASAVAMQELREDGYNFTRLDSSEFAEMRKVMYEQIEKADIDEYGGLTEELYNSYYDFYEVWYPYKKTSQWWGETLEPNEMMGFEPGTR